MFSETTTTLPIQDLPTGSISKRIRESSSPRDPFLQKRTLTNVFKETTITLLIQDSLTNSLPKRIRSVPTKKKEKRTLTNILRERTLMNVLRETHPPQTRKNSPTGSISKRIWKSPSPRDPFLQKRMLMNVL